MQLVSRAGSILSVWLSLTAAPLWAQARTALSWVREPGAEPCIAAPELGRKVERMIGPVLSSAADGQISIEGRIARARDGFAATVVVSDAAGTILGRRELRGEGDDCRALDEQLAFVIAVAIDPDAALAQLPGEFSDEHEPGEALLAELQANPPRPAPRPAPRARKPPAGDPTPATERAEPPLLRAAAGPAVAAGVPVGPSAGPSLMLGVSWGGWTHGVRGVYWLPPVAPIRSGLGVELGLWQLGLGSCRALWMRAGWELALCGGAVFARLSAAPADFDGAEHDRWLFGPELGARIGRRLVPAAWLVLGTSAQTLWPRHAVVYETADVRHTVYRVPEVMGVLALSLELRF